MIVDLQSLKKDVEDYPNKLRTALLRERKLERLVETLQEEIDALEEEDDAETLVPSPRAALPRYAILNRDAELMRLKRDLGRLQQKKLLEISRDPSAYGLPVRATQKAIDAAVASDAEVVALQDRIDARQELLLTEEEPEDANAPALHESKTPNQDILERKRQELQQIEQAVLEARVEREVIERALPLIYELLVQLSQVK